LPLCAAAVLSLCFSVFPRLCSGSVCRDPLGAPISFLVGPPHGLLLDGGALDLGGRLRRGLAAMDDGSGAALVVQGLHGRGRLEVAAHPQGRHVQALVQVELRLDHVDLLVIGVPVAGGLLVDGARLDGGVQLEEHVLLGGRGAGGARGGGADVADHRLAGVVMQCSIPRPQARGGGEVVRMEGVGRGGGHLGGGCGGHMVEEKFLTLL